MERKEGEEFEYKGVKLRIEEEIMCSDRCYFRSTGFCPKEFSDICGNYPLGSIPGAGVIFVEVKDMNEENKQSILDEAKAIVDGSRHSDYGDARESFSRVATIASVMTGKELAPEDCCSVLMAVKLVRESFKHKRDNLVDLCGYAHIMNELNENESEKKGE